jgi:hypothetical protein
MPLSAAPPLDEVKGSVLRQASETMKIALASLAASASTMLFTGTPRIGSCSAPVIGDLAGIR